MNKASRIYPYLLGLIFVAIIALAAGPAASGDPASVDGWLGVMPPSPELLERVERGEAKLPQVMVDPVLRRSLGVNQPAEMIQPSGSWRAIALLVQFTDNPATTSATYFDTLLFETGTGTLKDYFNEVSYGTLDIVTVNLPSSIGWMTMPQTYAYYVAGNNGFGAYPRNAQRLAEDAVWAANPIVNYANYDNDGDGYVESLFVIHAGSGAEYTGSSNDIWSHRWAMLNDPYVDGVTLNGYTMEPEYWSAPGDMTVGVYAHELAHAFGLPDLYDTDYSSEGIGRWALMAGGSWNGKSGDSPAWFSAWSRAFLGFVNPTNVISNSTGVNIPSAETSQTVYRLWTNGGGGNEYFLVENRQPIGYDAALPGSGVLIWHIDDSKNGNQNECAQLNNWNCGASHPLVALEQADGLFDLERAVNRGDVRDPFPGSTNNRNFAFGTVPNSSSYYHNSDTCVGVNNISSSTATMTADFTVTCQPPTISGYVRTSGGAGISGVVMNGLPDNPTTDASGFYSTEVAEGWSGTVQPLSAGLTFTPASRVYNNVTSDLANQDFSGANTVTAEFSGTPTSGFAALTVNFTDLSSGDYNSCLWNFGDGTSTTCGNISHTYSSGGVYTVGLTVSGAGGSDTETKVGYITVNDPITANFSGAPTVGTAPLTVNFTDLSSGDYDTCIWNFGDNGPTVGCGNPSRTYVKGVYTLSLTVSGAGGSDTETKAGYITVYDPVVAAFSGTPSAGHAPLTVNFINNSTGDVDSCLWEFGDGATSTSSSCGDSVHTYVNNGVYAVRLTVNGFGGDSDTHTETNYINVHQGGIAAFSGAPAIGAAPLTVSFSNNSTGDIANCLWEFGDLTTSSSCGNPSHTYTNAGKYTVSLTVTDRDGASNTETKAEYIFAGAPVTADFSGSPTGGPAPLAVKFGNKSTGDYDTCLWEFGDGNNSNNCNNSSHTYVTQGVYTVSLTVSGVGGSDKKTLTNYITVNQAGTANFSVAPLSGIAPLTVKFLNSPSGVFDTCRWDFGDGNSSNDCNDPSHTYVRPGVYSVSLTINGSGGPDSVTYKNLVTVYDPVEASFSAGLTAGSKPLLVNFTNLSSGDYDTCLWKFGDGNSSNDCYNPIHTYSTTGIFSVMLTVTGPGGSDNQTKVNYIVVKQYRLTLPIVLR